MEGAMVRLGEAGSKELYPVSQYYSSTLVTYIRTVLQVGKSSATYHLDQFNFAKLAFKVIPATMFSLLEQVMQMQAKLNELPTRF